MDVDALIKAIAAEISKQISGDEKKPPVLIIGEKTCKKCLAVEKMLGKEFHFLYPDENPGADKSLRRIVPYLSINHMADLASGKADGPLMEMVRAALLAGQKVEVMEYQYQRYAETAPEALMQLFEGQVATLATYGLTAIDLSRRDTLRIRKSLVTEADVAEAKQQGVSALLIPVNTQMTPLAVDSARELGISISRG